MRIGTLSLNINTDDLNYGAMLHSWAFSEFLSKLNPEYDVEIIDYVTPTLENFDRFKPVTSYLKMHHLKSASKAFIALRPYEERLSKFDAFTKINMHISAEHYDKQKLTSSNLDYDCLICESDVIWSPDFFEGKFDEVFFLATDNMKAKKKVIYAASTANANFTSESITDFSSLIQHPDFISCRERYGTEIIHRCGRKDAVTVVDPVFLLDSHDYDQICSERQIPEGYVLLYVPVGYDSRYANAAHKYADENHLKVVEISFYVWNRLKHQVVANVGIEEFLSLIKYADAVFTNSFHAVCFSCLFHKQFYAFERKTGRKTEDLCKRLGLSERYMRADEFHECQEIDFMKVDDLLNAERQQSISWLEKALNV